MTNDDDVSALLRDSAAGWLESQADLDRLRGGLDQVLPIDHDRWCDMAGMGWLGLMLPETLGGSALGLAEACELSTLFGRKLLVEPFIAAALMPSVIITAATGEAQAVLAAELVSGERMITLATHGDVLLDGDRLQGTVERVAAVDADGVLLVRAADNRGQAVIVAVENRASGVTLDSVAAGAGGSLSRVGFDHAPIRFAAPLLVGDAAVAALAVAVDCGRVALAAQLTGIAAEVLDKTLAYTGQRRQFGRTIASFQTVQHRCVDLHVERMLAEASVAHAARVPATARPAAAAAAKARAGDVALHTCRTAIQLHGAMGFTDEADIGLYMRAALHWGGWLGTGPQLRRQFLSEWRRRESDHG